MGPATKNRYPPYKKGSLNGAGNKKPLPTLQESYKEVQKIKIIIRACQLKWWATKTRYPPYKKGSLNGAGNKKPLPTLQESYKKVPQSLNGAGNKNPLPTLQERFILLISIAITLFASVLV